MAGMGPITASDPKAQIRASVIAARLAARDPRPRVVAAVRLWAALRGVSGRTVAGYLPVRGEVDPTGAMRSLGHDNALCMPVVSAQGAPLRFRDWRPGAALETGAMGVPVPAEGGWRVPDIVIVPLVAFDGGCGRLGYGGGFYDRTLAGLPGVTAIGLALEVQRVRQIPRESTDVDLDAVVTETGLHLRPGAR